MGVDRSLILTAASPILRSRIERQAPIIGHAGHGPCLPVRRCDCPTGSLPGREIRPSLGSGTQVDPALGQSWLARLDYLLDHRHRRVVIDGVPPEGGFSLALRSADGRPALKATVDGRPSELILDFGAPAVVIFQCGGTAKLQATRLTNGASVEGSETSVRIALPGDRERRMRGVCVNSFEPAPALLPASAFSEVFVSNRDGFIRLRP